MASYEQHQLRRVLSKMAGNQVAFELNPRHLGNSLNFFEELIILGQQVGIKFALGADAPEPHGTRYDRADLQTLNQIGVRQEHLLVMKR